MRIVTWNCNGALRKKSNALSGLNADVLIVQECENPKQSTNAYQEWAQNYLWIGQNKNKGIGVFARPEVQLDQLDWQGEYALEGLKSRSPALQWQTTDLELFLPFQINQALTVLAVWTKGRDDQVFGYMGQFWKYLQIHRDQLSHPNTIIAGDFNSNKQWDKSDRWWNHSSVVDELLELGIQSLYHKQTSLAQGDEQEKTFYHQRKLEKGYHIDYIFQSKDLLDQSTLAVGYPKDWLELSDHMPLICDID